tara:strand:- start:131 stop:352 length:222 start_codon:yes stop_codon:yes gene_type:complete
MKRIKHNDLLPWFTQDHGTLPASYLASCKEFFKWLEDSKRNGFQAPSSKRQASSFKLDKPQASSYSRIIKEKL